VKLEFETAYYQIMAIVNHERVLSMAVGASVVVLLVLAFLQYRWSRQVGAAVGDHIGATLKASMLDWHLDLLQELSAPCMALHVHSPVKDWEQTIEDYEQWSSTSQNSQLVEDVYVIQQVGGALRPFRMNLATEQIDAANRLPARMEGLPDRLKTESLQLAEVPMHSRDGGAPEGAPLAGCEFDPTTLTLVRPVTPHVDEDPTEMARPTAPPQIWLVFELNEHFLKNQLFSELARRYFSGPAGLDYYVAVVRGSGPREAIYSSDMPFHDQYVRPADAKLDIFGSEPVGGEGGRKDPAETRTGGTIKHNPVSAVERAGWHDFAAPLWFRIVGQRHKENDWYLEVKHRNRSLQDIMASTQWRERAVGLGVLVLLAISMAMVFLASRRAHRFARLQVDFVAAVSHELRTPVAVICSAADNLADGVVQGPQQLNQYRSIITSQARQLTLLVEQILTFTVNGGIKAGFGGRSLDVKEIVQAAIEKTEGLLRCEEFTVEHTIHPGLPQVKGDLVALSQCLQNLIVNAVKYSGTSRWIGIRAHTAETRNGEKEVQITVEDKGIGIAPTEVGAVFEAFFRSPSVAKGEIHGTGLGLSLAKSMAEAAGGRFSVVSKLGEGSAFTLHLPAVADRTAKPARPFTEEIESTDPSQAD
jgi:two-component system sensor histidine kinase SenX3